jgi:LysR family glycine cleavage system transcriptional activator
MPFGKTLDMGDFTYYLLTPGHRDEPAHMTTFRLWMMEQFRKAQPAKAGAAT